MSSLLKVRLPRKLRAVHLVGKAEQRGAHSPAWTDDPTSPEELLESVGQPVTVVDRAGVDLAALKEEIRREVGMEYETRWRLLNRLLEEAGALGQRLHQQAEATIVRLAVEIAHKIIHIESRIDPEVIKASVAAVLQMVSDGEQVVLQIHPDDLKLLHEDETVLHAIDNKALQLQMKANPAIERGGCVLETSTGMIDARLQSQWMEIERLMRASIE